MNKKIFKENLFSISLILIIILLSGIITIKHINKLNSEYILVYTVEDSDTLWSIANKFSKTAKKNNRLINRIQHTNDIDGNIYPGDKILIPIEI